MIDRKSLAAGDDTGESGPLGCNSDSPDSPKTHKNDVFEGNLPENEEVCVCDRCGQVKPNFGDCSGCVELNKKKCDCGCLAELHSFSRTQSTNRRLWICSHCFPTCLKLSCDPIAQFKKLDPYKLSNATGMPGINIWIDKKEEL